MHFKKISDLYIKNGYPEPVHPKFGMAFLEGSGSKTGKSTQYTSDFYLIGFKRVKSGVMHYGKTNYDYDRGTMFFFKPRQKISITDVKLDGKGFVIHIHEELLLEHNLLELFNKYSYFDYESDEALHLSLDEEQIIWNLQDRMDFEYRNSVDQYSIAIILSYIATILNYAERFYKRQFTNRKVLSGHIATKFNRCLTDYFLDGETSSHGLPTVQQMASKLNLSAKYLSDLLKIETDKTALELIHQHIINEAKKLLLDQSNSISEIAYVLGFENPPYFSRLFKKETGQTPMKYRQSIKQKQ